MLVALLLLLVFTLRTTVVSIFSSISRPLAITIMTIVVSMVFINNPGVMANNTRMMITRLLFFMTVGLGYILTLLNICNIQLFHNQHSILHALVLLGSCGTVGPSCHDNEDHHAAGTQYVHGLHGLDEQLHTQMWQTEGQPGISFLIE